MEHVSFRSPQEGVHGLVRIDQSSRHNCERVPTAIALCFRASGSKQVDGGMAGNLISELGPVPLKESIGVDAATKLIVEGPSHRYGFYLPTARIRSGAVTIVSFGSNQSR